MFNCLNIHILCFVDTVHEPVDTSSAVCFQAANGFAISSCGKGTYTGARTSTKGTMR